MSDMAGTIPVVLVTSPGCHFCDDARLLLDELAAAYPLRIETIPLTSDYARSLAVRYRIPFPPIMMIDDQFFGYGRISRRKLETHLAARSTGKTAG